MTGQTTRRGVIAAMIVLLNGCASRSPTLYTLEAPAGPVRRFGPRVIELRTPGIARYLERSQIVRSSENYRLDVLPNDWWGEPLDAMVGRVMVRALSQRLPGSTVYLETSAISAPPDATVRLDVQRFDQKSDGDARLAAQFSVTVRATETRGVTLDVPVRGPAIANLVAAMSEALGQLADRIAATLAVG
jgi:uncharacterized lipoprotein YmbA